MTEERDSIALRDLRRIDEKNDQIVEGVREVKERLGFREQTYTSISRRLDRAELRIERIEKRLDLADA